MTQSDNVTTVAHYEDDEADFIYACLGRMGYGGLLRIGTPVTGQSRWEWVRRGTDHWDALHQKIYRNFRATQLEDSELPRLPPLPAADLEPPRYRTPTSFPAAAYPRLREFLFAQADATSEFVAVLGEDTYESSMGDGEFHYLQYLGKSPQDAQDYIAKQQLLPDAGYSRYHVRNLSLTLAGPRVDCVLDKQVFDHCDLETALKFAEAWAQTTQCDGT